jgi:hypothetical protein
MVPAGWLDMASEISSQFPFIPAKQEDTNMTAFLVEESEEDADITGADDGEEDFLSESDSLTGDEDGSLLNGSVAISSIDEPGND